MKKKNAEGSTIEKAKKKFRSVIGSEGAGFPSFQTAAD